MSHSKHGNNSKGPSFLRYWAEGHRTRNKMKRIIRCNGVDFAAIWEKAHGKK